jgi:hypothetical protein
MISIVAVPLLAIIVGILRPCIRYRYPLCLYRKLKSYVFWNGTFQTITGTYTILVMCVLINTKHVSFCFYNFSSPLGLLVKLSARRLRYCSE